MPTDLFSCPPLHLLEPEEANAVLLDAADLEDLTAVTDGKVTAAELEAFAAALEHHTFMAASTGGMCDSTTFYGWVWHAGFACGAVYEHNSDLPPESWWMIAIDGHTSRHLADAFTQLLQDTDYMPVNFLGMRVELYRRGGIALPDLLDAMAKGVFTKEPELGDPADVARKWVEQDCSQLP